MSVISLNPIISQQMQKEKKKTKKPENQCVMRRVDGELETLCECESPM